MSWQERLIRSYPTLFVRTFRGVEYSPGYPMCSDGWQHIVSRLAERVDAASEGTAVHFTQIIEFHGMLRIHWTSLSELPQWTELSIEEAVSLAEARSVCSCVDCGAEGRLFASNFLLFPVCERHRRGTPVPDIRGSHDVYVRRSIVGGRPTLVRCRYDRVLDAFVDLPHEFRESLTC
jgi:hypothetical protein